MGWCGTTRIRQSRSLVPAIKIDLDDKYCHTWFLGGLAFMFVGVIG